MEEENQEVVKITLTPKVAIKLLHGENTSLRAYATLYLGNFLIINGIKVYENGEEIHVYNPSFSTGRGKSTAVKFKQKQHEKIVEKEIVKSYREALEGNTNGKVN